MEADTEGNHDGGSSKVIQGDEILGDKVLGDKVLGDKNVYARSQREELRDYLQGAVVAYVAAAAGPHPQAANASGPAVQVPGLV